MFAPQRYLELQEKVTFKIEIIKWNYQQSHIQNYKPQHYMYACKKRSTDVILSIGISTTQTPTTSNQNYFE